MAPLCALNLTVAWLGDTVLFPLSPWFLKAKGRAVLYYARHRVSCLWGEHAALEPVVAAAARRHGLPPGLLESVVTVESGWRVHRISPAGAMGPGQLFPATAARMGVEDPFDPAEALDAS